MKRNRTPPENRRTRWFADPRLQCGLLARTILYWAYSVFTVGTIALVWIVFARRPQTPSEWIDQLWLNCGPLAVGSVLILPLVLLDCLRFSRRFAGPMVRFRRSLHDLASGNPTDPIVLRKGDFWYEFARDVNRIAQRLDDFQSRAASLTVIADASDGEAGDTFDVGEDTADFGSPITADSNSDQPRADEIKPEARPPAILPAATDLGHLSGEVAPPTSAGIYA